MTLASAFLTWASRMSQMPTKSTPSMEASCEAWPEPRAPTPMIATFTFSSFGAAKSPIYYAPDGREEALFPLWAEEKAGNAASRAVRPPKALRKPRR